MPRKKLGRMKVRVPDEETARKYLLWLSGRELHYEPEILPKIRSDSLFGNDRPLELEVGCGSGEFLCSLAREHPEVNFVGIDRHRKSLYKAIEEASGKALENILFIGADFRFVYPLLSDESLQAIHLRFPDPGAKARERRKRLFSKRFVDEAHRALVPGGRLVLITDDEDYFEQALATVEEDGRWKKESGQGRPADSEGNARSRFERMWEQRGRQAFWLELTKSSTVG